MNKFKEVYAYFYTNENLQKDISDDSVKVVLDTNILLDFYRSPAESVEQGIELLGNIKDKIHLPFQVGYEYHINKKSSEIRSKQNWERYIKEVEKNINNIFSDTPEDIKTINKTVNKKSVFNELKKEFREKVISKLSSYLKQTDDIPEKIMSLYEEENIHPQPSSENYELWSKEAEERFKKNVPPGLGDSKKTNTLFYSNGQYQAKYGDYFLWKEMCGLLSEGDELVFVTNDLTKGDWVYEVNGTRIGPRIELIQELYDEKKATLRIIQLSELLGELHGDPKLIDAVKEVEEDSRVSRTSQQQKHFDNIQNLLNNINNNESLNNLNKVTSDTFKNPIDMEALNSFNKVQEIFETNELVKNIEKENVSIISGFEDLDENQKKLMKMLRRARGNWFD